MSESKTMNLRTLKRSRNMDGQTLIVAPDGQVAIVDELEMTMSDKEHPANAEQPEIAGLVKRLNWNATSEDCLNDPDSRLLTEAADALTALQAKCERLEREDVGKCMCVMHELQEDGKRPKVECEYHARLRESAEAEFAEFLRDAERLDAMEKGAKAKNMKMAEDIGFAIEAGKSLREAIDSARGAKNEV